MANHPHVMTVTQWAGGAPWVLELQHSCADHALIWQTRGQGRCVLEGVRHGLSVHTAVVIPAGTPFSMALGKQSFALVCLVPAGGSLMMPGDAQILRIRDAQAQVELTSILEAMQREQNSQRAFVDEALSAQGALLTVWLRRVMIEHPTPEAKITAAIRLAHAFSALIERGYRSGKPMVDYARTLGVTPTHLTRVCQTTAGQTAATLLTERSLHAARMALERGDRPVREIAATLGFNSAAYFSRFVQHHTGLSPSALRRHAQHQKGATAA